MQLDDEICLCFHVTQRKLLSFLRVERSQRASQLSECFGAGTGCGWCRPYLQQMFAEATGQPPSPAAELPEKEDYARWRAEYIQEGNGTPPAETAHDP